MDFAKLPTDNLYKFLAISGVALVVVAVVWPIQVSKEADEKMSVLARSIELRLPKFQTVYSIPGDDADALRNKLAKPPPKADDITQKMVDSWPDAVLMLRQNTPVIVNPAKADGLEREHWKVHLLKRAMELQKESNDFVPKENESIEAFGERVFPPAMRKILKPEQYPAVCAAKIEQIGKVLEEVRLTRIEVEEMWRLRDYADQNQKLGWCGIGVGSVLAVVGFWLWYSRVQRFQDQLLRAEVKEAQKTS